MKRSENVGLMVMGGAVFAATFAGGMTYMAMQRPSYAAQTCTPAPRHAELPAGLARLHLLLSIRVNWGSSASTNAKPQQQAALTSTSRPAATTVSASGTERSGFGSSAKSSFRVIRRRLNFTACSESPATSGRTGASGPTSTASASTPSRASATGTSAPITPSRCRRSSATSRRRPPSSTRCAANWSRARSMTSACSSCCASPSASGPSSRRAGSAATRASTAASICPMTGRGRRSCSNTTPTRRRRSTRPACSSGCGWRTRSPATRSRRMPTSTTRCTSG